MRNQNDKVITERVFANERVHLGASPVGSDLSARAMRRIVGGGIERGLATSRGERSCERTTEPLPSRSARITAGPAESSSLRNGEARRRIGTLEQALAYRNEDVLYKFLSLYKLPYAEAEDIFRETRRWLWMCAKLNSDRVDGQQEGPQLAIDRSMIAIDEMWHTFILFTPDYIEFCLNHFGLYFHHVPNRKKESEQYQQSVLNDAASAIRQAQAEAFAKYEYVYDLFGEEVFRKWFVEYPKKYDVARLRKMHAGLAP